MSTSSLSVIVTVFVLKLHHPGPRPQKVPRWIRILVLGFLSAIVKCTCGGKKKSSKQNQILSSSFSIQDLTDSSSLFLSNHKNVQAEKMKKLADDMMKHIEEDDLIENDSPIKTQEQLSNIDAIMYHLSLIVSQSNKADTEFEIIDEWKEVAHVADRVAFLVFFLVTLSAATVILVIVPSFVYVEKEGL